MKPCLNLSQSFKVQNKHQKKFKKWSGVSVIFVNAVLSVLPLSVHMNAPHV